MWKTIRAGIPWLQPSPLAQQVIRLLISDRTGWIVDPYRMTHGKTGIAIWTANEENGLHIEYPCDDEFFGRDIRLSKRDRRAIYKAADWDKHDRQRAATIAASW